MKRARTVFGLGKLLASLVVLFSVSSPILSLFANNFVVPTANPLPNLAISNVADGQIQLLLNAEPAISHTVELSADLAEWIPAVTNSDNSTNRPISLPAPAGAAFYRVSRDPIPIFAYALATRQNMSLMGLGILFDSWNSHDTNQSLNGLYDGYSGTNADIAVSEGIADIGNHVVMGDFYLGPNASFSLGSSGGISGYLYGDCFLLFPDVTLPAKDTNGNPISWTPAPGNATSHTFTTNGYYLINDNGTIIVQPGVKVTLNIRQSNFTPSGFNIQGGTTNAGMVVIYQTSGSLTLGGTSGGAIHNRPENFAYYGLPGVSQITFNSSFSFVGAIYAPSATAQFLGGGSAMNFVGSCIVSNVTVIGHANFHYDTSLKTNGPCR